MNSEELTIPSTNEVVENSDQIKNALDKGNNKKKRKGKMCWFVKIPRDFYSRAECQQLICSAPSKLEGVIRVELYIHMLLLACYTNGVLFLSSSRPFTPFTLATSLGLDSKDESQVRMLKETMSVLNECGVVYLDERATIHITTFDELTESTTETALKRRQERLANSISESEKIKNDELAKLAKMKWLDD